MSVLPDLNKKLIINAEIFEPIDIKWDRFFDQLVKEGEEGAEAITAIGTVWLPRFITMDGCGYECNQMHVYFMHLRFVNISICRIAKLCKKNPGMKEAVTSKVQSFSFSFDPTNSLSNPWEVFLLLFAIPV